MPSSRTSERTIVGRRRRTVIAAAVGDIERLRVDAGVSIARLAGAAGLDPGYLSRVVRGDRLPTIPVLVALTRALGADLSVRAFPTTGPNIHDRVQARIGEELLRIAAPSWSKAVEVRVSSPARGFVDLVLDRAEDLVATEVHTRLDRLEQTIRWADEKARSLPSSDLWRTDRSTARVHKLLVLRSTVATREIARRFQWTLRAAYPARAADLHAALTELDRPWPGDGILWADVTGNAVRILARPPRGIDVGR